MSNVNGKIIIIGRKIITANVASLAFSPRHNVSLELLSIFLKTQMQEYKLWENACELLCLFAENMQDNQEG